MGYVKIIKNDLNNVSTGQYLLVPADNVMRVLLGGDDDIKVQYASGFEVTLDYQQDSYSEADVQELKEAINMAGGNSGPAILWSNKETYDTSVALTS